MEILSYSTVEVLSVWRPAWPDPMAKLAVVGAITWVPLMETAMVAAVPVPVTWNRTVYQVLALMVKLAWDDWWKPLPPLS